MTGDEFQARLSANGRIWRGLKWRVVSRELHCVRWVTLRGFSVQWQQIESGSDIWIAWLGSITSDTNVPDDPDSAFEDMIRQVTQRHRDLGAALEGVE